MGLRSQCTFKLVTFVSSSCLQLQLQSTPSTSPRRTSSGLLRRLSRTRRVIPTLRCTIVFSRCLFMQIRKRMALSAYPLFPRAYGYAPEDSELYKTEAEKDAARQKMFDS